MCLIAYVPEGKEVPTDILENAFNRNHDGWGLMGVDKVTKEPLIVKDVTNYADFQERYKEFRPRVADFGMHFRFATAGKKNRKNAHPYVVLEPCDPANAGRGIWLMHNGVIHDVGSSPKWSDTALFISKVLEPILRDNPNLDQDMKFWGLVADRIGSGNKFLCMDEKGIFTILNKNQGTVKEGIWYSNSNCFPTQNVYSYGYNRNYCGHDTLKGKRWCSKTMRYEYYDPRTGLYEHEWAMTEGTAGYEELVAECILGDPPVAKPPVAKKEVVSSLTTRQELELFSTASLESVEEWVFMNPEMAAALMHVLLKRVLITDALVDELEEAAA